MQPHEQEKLLDLHNHLKQGGTLTILGVLNGGGSLDVLEDGAWAQWVEGLCFFNPSLKHPTSYTSKTVQRIENEDSPRVLKTELRGSEISPGCSAEVWCKSLEGNQGVSAHGPVQRRERSRSDG